MKRNLFFIGALSTLLFFSACGGANGDGSDTSTGSRADTPRNGKQPMGMGDTVQRDGAENSGTSPRPRPANSKQ